MNTEIYITIFMDISRFAGFVSCERFLGLRRTAAFLRVGFYSCFPGYNRYAAELIILAVGLRSDLKERYEPWQSWSNLRSNLRSNTDPA